MSWSQAATSDASSLERDARRGDYQAQRKLQGLLGLPVDPRSACAWRTVIARSGNAQVDCSDTDNLRFACSKLTPADRAAATGQGELLVRKIYGR